MVPFLSGEDPMNRQTSAPKRCPRQAGSPRAFIGVDLGLS
jgi:hypothetical protein